ncbi:hypothetical protein G9A89_014365 [Geosiphon pyriformis]|nr:hypothetical protein G9A89_014365 [Geosiphon pyriformis]
MTTEYSGGVNGIFMVNDAMSPAEDIQAKRYYIFIKNGSKKHALVTIVVDKDTYKSTAVNV